MPGLDLIVLDYSGTLSYAATLFGRPARLARELRLSGLKDVGIDTPALFWDEIVNPTWTEGSLTAAGYTEVMRRRILECRPQSSDSDHARRVAAAASRFVRSYLAAATIHPAWIPVLRDLAERPGLQVVVATDHYAEATPAILDHLRAAGVEAVQPGARDALRSTFYVANSADLGSHKASEAFWRDLRERMARPPVSRVLWVDDFGANEFGADAYSDPRKVADRTGKAAEQLRRVWEAPVRVVPFLLGKVVPRGDGERETGRFRRLVSETSRVICGYL